MTSTCPKCHADVATGPVMTCVRCRLSWRPMASREARTAAIASAVETVRSSPFCARRGDPEPQLQDGGE